MFDISSSFLEGEAKPSNNPRRYLLVTPGYSFMVVLVESAILLLFLHPILSIYLVIYNQFALAVYLQLAIILINIEMNI